ncbi:tRNA-adenosine deaminase [Isosphaera pallida ATCC 43644]|uniref:tRNA-specific adenosine deaminase n=1 Tax=Isosphaera pallida (strain ATCC 43644 / DSM 9630 / IS1B) TaxID=575540 RepID=E8R2B8_ISOPI|nr:tRNA-adenosine deaminase [Isosphaera pallida ATCC 43644]
MSPDPSSDPSSSSPVWTPTDYWAMTRALDLARAAVDLGEVPVGAVVLDPLGRLLAQAHNLRETLEDPTAHAERLVLTWAARGLGTWRLEGCTLYVTLEPCVMCAGAIVLARVARVVYATNDPKAGACSSLYRILDDSRLNHRPQVEYGLFAREAGDLLRAFFRARRRPRADVPVDTSPSGSVPFW